MNEQKKCRQCAAFFMPAKRQQRCNNCIETGQRKISALPRSCPECGDIFTPAHRNWQAQYCSRRCKDQKPRQSLVCQWCASEFASTQGVSKGVKYCSRSCASSAKASSPAFTPVYFRECGVCKKHCTTTRRDYRYCQTCVDAHGYAKCRAISRGSLTTNCTSCGVRFSRLYGCKDRVCSSECRMTVEVLASKACKARRRHKARTNGAYESFDPLEILERDNWSCQSCGCSTPRELRGTQDDNAPELDHIVPLSKGGDHTRDNTQCLCRVCNILKSDSLDWVA